MQLPKLSVTIYAHTLDEIAEVNRYLNGANSRSLQMDLKMQPLSMVSGAIGPILDKPEFKAVITPGNSFGVMTGGFDKVIRDHYRTSNIQGMVTDIINKDYLGECNVGDAFLVQGRTKGLGRPMVIAYAPTMRVPTLLPKNTDIPYLATRAGLLKLAAHFPADFSSSINVLVPLMCANTGGVPLRSVIRQIHMALMTINNPMLSATLSQGSTVDSLIKQSI